MLRLLLYICYILLSLNGAVSSLDFVVSRWLNCPKLSRNSMKFIGISVGDCVDECTKRESCTSVIFSYRINLCEVNLEDNDEIPDENTAVGGSCSLIKKEDMHTSSKNVASGLNKKGHVCDATTGRCRKECDTFRIENGTVFGNRRHVGAKVAFKCITGFFEEHGARSATCLEKGEWSISPICKQIDTTVSENSSISTVISSLIPDTTALPTETLSPDTTITLSQIKDSTSKTAEPNHEIMTSPVIIDTPYTLTYSGLPGTITLPETMTSPGSVSSPGIITSPGTVKLSETIASTGTIILPETIESSGTATLPGTMTSTGITTSRGTVTSPGIMTSPGTMTLQATMTTRGTVTLPGIMTSLGLMTSRGTVTSPGAMTSSGIMTSPGIITSRGTVTLPGIMTARETVTLPGALSSQGIMSLRGTVTSPGAMTASGIMTSPGIMTSRGTVALPGVMTSPGIMTSRGTVTLPGTMTSPGTVTSPGIITSHGLVTLPGILTSTGKMTSRGTVTLPGAMTSQGIMKLRGTVTTPGIMTLPGTMTSRGTVALPGVMTSPGTMTSRGTVTLPGTMPLVGTIASRGTVTSPGIMTLHGTVTSPGIMTSRGIVTLPRVMTSPGTMTSTRTILSTTLYPWTTQSQHRSHLHESITHTSESKNESIDCQYTSSWRSKTITIHLMLKTYEDASKHCRSIGGYIALFFDFDNDKVYDCIPEADRYYRYWIKRGVYDNCLIFHSEQKKTIPCNNEDEYRFICS